VIDVDGPAVLDIRATPCRVDRHDAPNAGPVLGYLNGFSSGHSGNGSGGFRFCRCGPSKRKRPRGIRLQPERHLRVGPANAPAASNRYMNKLQLKGSWNEIKGKLKQSYGNLTDDDLTFAEGKDDELLGRLQKKLGKSKEEVKQMIEGL
jgi:uncharacterized protein YjbJ (UPF0337 family)